MNIALITSSALVSKKEATWLTLLSLAKEYTKQGHKAIICAEKNAELPEIEEVEGIKIYRSHKGKIFSGRKALSNIANSENISFDIIHGFSSSPLLVLNTFFAGRTFPKAKTVHTIKSYSQHRAVRTVFSSLLHSVDKVTLPSKRMKESIGNAKLQKKIKIISSPINTAKFKPRDREALKEKYGYQGKKIILYYGALRKKKGVDYVIQAMPSILTENPGVFFLFAIRSKVEERKQRYEKIIEKLGCQNNAKITLEDLPIEEYVSMADMVVLAYPTLIGTEGNPSCLLESMAAKTPVVTTNLPELREIVEHEKDVLMAEPKNVESLAFQIKRLLRENRLGKKLTENAHPKSKQFDTQHISKQFLKLYDDLLNTNQ